MGRKRKVIKHEVPEQILNNLNEHFAHGWFLFGYNFDGELQIFSNFDNELAFKALKSDTMKWLNCVDNIESQQMMMSLVSDK